MYVFDQAIDSIYDVAKNTKLEEVLYSARNGFEDGFYEAELNPIDAMAEGVLFAQQATSRIVPVNGKIPEKYQNDKVRIYAKFSHKAESSNSKTSFSRTAVSMDWQELMLSAFG